MRSIRLKTTCTGNHVHTTLAHPGAPLGDIRDASVQIRQVNNIPDGMELSGVIRLFEQTCDVTALFGEQRLEFDFRELGTGKIISK